MEGVSAVTDVRSLSRTYIGQMGMGESDATWNLTLLSRWRLGEHHRREERRNATAGGMLESVDLDGVLQAVGTW